MKNRITIILAAVLVFLGNSVLANHGVDPTKNAFKKWNKQFVAYPEVASVNNEQGVIYVSFELSVEGETKNVALESKLSGDLNIKAIEIVEKMPKGHLYENGFIEGTRFVVPVKFDIQD